MSTIKINNNKIKMIAHRGLSGLEPENTIAACIAAANRSYYGIEFDIHKTADQVYVVIHDDNTLRVSGINKTINTTSIKELQDISLYDVDGFVKPHLRVPRLSEYLDICKKYQKKAVIEFKQEFTAQDINKIIDLIIKLDYLENCIVISFHLDNLITLRKISKDINIQYLVSEFDPKILDICMDNHFDIDINYLALSEELVKQIKSKNIKINVWTVDDPEIAKNLISWDVDYITTNILE